MRLLSYTVLDKDYQKKEIVIDPVTQFAYGQYKNGDVALWAAGSAGWYLIDSPAPKYKRYFTSMEDAVKAFYFLVDKNTKKGRRKSIGVDRILESVSRVNHFLRMQPQS